MADALARLTILLDRAKADGLKVIAIEAVERALSDADFPPEVDHILVVVDGRWLIRHPDDCFATPCPVAQAAHRTLTGAPYADGEYTAWPVEHGWLATKARQP